MKEIVINSPKHGRHLVTVDDEDFELVNKYVWRVNKKPYTYYAMTNIGGNKPMKMHKLILGSPHERIDHIDGNGLNNTRANLRLCTQAQNGMNRGANKNNTTGYKGVVIMKGPNHEHRVKKYYAQIKYNYKMHFLGYFHNAEQAAAAYNNAAIKHHGEFAQLNKLPEHLETLCVD